MMKLNWLQAQTIDYSVHANIIYRFTKYVEWPEEIQSGEFVIGIIGDSHLFEWLQISTKNKTVGEQRIVIRKYDAFQPVYNCQILFINEDKSGAVKKIAAATQNDPVLLVTESEGLGQKGSCINFIIEDDHLTLEFNVSNIEGRKLKIASELINLGTVIEKDKSKTAL